MVSGVRNLNVVQLMVLAQGLLWSYSQAISWCYSHLNDWLGPEHPSKTAHLMKASTTSPVVVGISPWFLATQTLHSAAWVNSWTLNLAPGFPRGKYKECKAEEVYKAEATIFSMRQPQKWHDSMSAIFQWSHRPRLIQWGRGLYRGCQEAWDHWGSS